ncbi:hypothetical protein B6V74_12370 [Thioclava sp. F42-5]|uniref:hypothetical protein n=1 Tax=unclassified Thioclava TaxID=2621713 RepID=UPI000B548A3E|nr:MULTISPECIES: hypothetical protein [unclassified Thioclava]OWY08619.1 hypothetical protein B6V74_12370 [Thioclava sp. F42-5]OWY11781.1 hypothetical protein B6V72_15745 [Thioclava sp. F34-6]
MFREKFANIVRAEDGAVTVDWVVLTASIVSLGFMAAVLIWDKTGGASRNISQYISTQEVVTTFGESELGK